MLQNAWIHGGNERKINIIKTEKWDKQNPYVGFKMVNKAYKPLKRLFLKKKEVRKTWKEGEGKVRKKHQ